MSHASLIIQDYDGCAHASSVCICTQMNGYVVEECLFSLLEQFSDDLKCLHQLIDLLLALLQVNTPYFCIFKCIFYFD